MVWCLVKQVTSLHGVVLNEASDMSSGRGAWLSK